MTQTCIQNYDINLFVDTITSANKYTNFTENNNIPNFEIMCFVHDVDHCNSFFKIRNINTQFEKNDYQNDNLIIINFNNTLVCFVYVFDYENMKGPRNPHDLMFWYKIKQFNGLKHTCIFKPRYAKQNSLTKPYFSFFPYFFGEHDKQILYHNAMYKSYYFNVFIINVLLDEKRIKKARIFYFNANNNQIKFLNSI